MDRQEYLAWLSEIDELSAEQRAGAGGALLLNFVRARVAKGSIVSADEAKSWDALHANFEMKRINHEVPAIGGNVEEELRHTPSG
jgi:hypothetical protein